MLGVIWGEDHALRFVPQVTVRSLSVLWEVRGEPSGNRSVLRAAFTTEPAVLEHSLRWIESPKLGSSIQRVVTGHFKGPIPASGVFEQQLQDGSRPGVAPLSGPAGLTQAELLGDGEGKGQGPL